jgi:hypothetical protein
VWCLWSICCNALLACNKTVSTVCLMREGADVNIFVLCFYRAFLLINVHCYTDWWTAK